MRTTVLSCGAFLLVVCSACTGAAPPEPDAGPGDSGTIEDAGPDAGPEDGGPPGAGEGPVGIPLAGCGVNYTAAVTIGDAQTFTFILDTGSATTGVAGSDCPSCIDGGVAPLYTPGPTATDEHRAAAAAYADTTGFSGEVYRDQVSLGTGPTARVDLIDIQAQKIFFSVMDFWCGASVSGILGLGPSILLDKGTSSYLDAAADGGMPDVFSFQLCPRSGTLWLGEVGGGFEPQYVTMADGVPFYATMIDSIDVGGTSLGLSTSDFGAAFVDTGGQELWLPEPAFDSVVAAIGKDANFIALFGDAKTLFGGMGPCVPLKKTAAELDALLPPLTLNFASGLHLQSPATSSYLYDLPQCGYIGALATRGPQHSGLPPIEMGAPALKNKLVVIDRAKKRIGFATAPCP